MTNTNTFTTIAELVAELNTAVDLVVPAGRVNDYDGLHNAVIAGTMQILAKHGLEIPLCWDVKTDSNYQFPHNCEQVPLGYVLVDLVLDKGQKTSRRGKHKGVVFTAEGPQDLPVQAWIRWANVQRLEARHDELADRIMKAEEALEYRREDRLAVLRSIEIERAEMERLELEAHGRLAAPESETQIVLNLLAMIRDWQTDDNDSLTKAINAGTVFLELKEYLEQRLLDRHQEDLPAPGCDICNEERLPGRSFCRRCWELEHSDPEYPEVEEK